VKNTTPNHITLQFRVDRLQFRALGVAVRRIGMLPAARETEAAKLLVIAALANLHILQPHMMALAGYCSREGIEQDAAWADLITRQFKLTKKGGAL
jgi:hypothetical protein